MKAEFRDSLIRKIGGAGFNKLRKTTVGIAGAGGLGSNCAANLIRVGFNRLKIYDFDVVEPSNLDRQFYFSDQVGMHKVHALKQNLLRIHPDLEIHAEVRRIEKDCVAELFEDCSVVAECFDQAEYKSMLLTELLPHGDKLIVSVSGLGGYGSSDDIRVQVIRKNLIIIGDLHSDVADRPALSPRVSIAAAKQADVILEHVLRKD